MSDTDNKDIRWTSEEWEIISNNLPRLVRLNPGMDVLKAIHVIEHLLLPETRQKLFENLDTYGLPAVTRLKRLWKLGRTLYRQDSQQCTVRLIKTTGLFDAIVAKVMETQLRQLDRN